ncbi:MAG: carotenoid biosynthesis protein [Longimicrobiales bacterium]|nr:carotenoid biosynthesis protein [Longimicrobiales bacterium]
MSAAGGGRAGSADFAARWVRTPEAIALAGFLLFTLVALAGYWAFGLAPERLPRTAWAAAVYQRSFPWFARLHILISGAVLLLALRRHAGLRWVGALTAVYLLSFTAEHVGTGYGIPFSGYAYTGLLGPRLLDRVPLVIPLSWFLMAAPAWVLARATFPRADQAVARVLQATLLLVLWDLALDPAMSFLAPYWVWEAPGAFYGMPWVNLAGWAGTGVVLMIALEALQRSADWAGSLPVRWTLGYYLTVLLMPLGMVTAAGLWGAVAATLGALGLAGAVHRAFAPARAPGTAASPFTVAAEGAS